MQKKGTSKSWDTRPDLTGFRDHIPSVAQYQFSRNKSTKIEKKMSSKDKWPFLTITAR